MPTLSPSTPTSSARPEPNPPMMSTRSSVAWSSASGPAWCVAPGCEADGWPRAMADFDLLFESGIVVDGTGSPGFAGSLGVSGDRLQVLRGDTSEHRAARRVEARGRVIAPGFID